MSDKTWIESGEITAPTAVDKALAWIKTNREKFVIGVVVAAAVGLFAAYFVSNYRELRETAWKNLFIAQQTGFSGRTDEAQMMLKNVETTYARTSAAGYAVLTNGDIYFAKGNYKEAEAEYSKLLANAELKPFAMYSLAKTKEAAGELPAAQAYYNDMMSAYPEHFLAPEAQWSLSRIYETSGKSAEARAAWDKIVLLYPETSWANMAREKLSKKS